MAVQFIVRVPQVWYTVHTVQPAYIPLAHRHSATITAKQLQAKEVLPRGRFLMSTSTTTDHGMSWHNTKL